ncbi:hypothetical protein [Aquabacterium humicola]|uniref:hypothetical protein n=1 Tax=Aquabacterium humicola TaxID=3237377 RepID=UPI00254282C0|nr:hypothetical protein [Rubrivivax pictus]
MKLAVYADSTGHIAGLAVCRITYSSDPANPREISMRAEPLDKRGRNGSSFRTHLVDMPPHLAQRSDDELGETLQEIHKTMRLDLTRAIPSLLACGEPIVPAHHDPATSRVEQENQQLRRTVVEQALELQRLREGAAPMRPPCSTTR